MGSRRVVVVVTALAFAIAGCGDDDGGSDEAAETVDAGAGVAQDAEAKANARELVTFVEACFIDNQDYSQCENAAGQEDVGEATVEAPSAAEFVVISPSESGNEFRVTKGKDGSLESTCETPGEGGCADDGSW